MKRYLWPIGLLCLLFAIPALAADLTLQAKGNLTTLDDATDLRGWVNLWVSDRLSTTLRAYVRDPDTTAVESFASYTFGDWVVSAGAEYVTSSDDTYTEVALSYRLQPLTFLTVTGYFDSEFTTALYEIEGAYDIPIYKSLALYLTSLTRYYPDDDDALTTERATIGVVFPICQREHEIWKLAPYMGYAFGHPETDDAEHWHVGLQTIVWTF